MHISPKAGEGRGGTLPSPPRPQGPGDRKGPKIGLGLAWKSQDPGYAVLGGEGNAREWLEVGRGPACYMALNRSDPSGDTGYEPKLSVCL